MAKYNELAKSIPTEYVNRGYKISIDTGDDGYFNAEDRSYASKYLELLYDDNTFNNMLLSRTLSKKDQNFLHKIRDVTKNSEDEMIESQKRRLNVYLDFTERHGDKIMAPQHLKDKNDEIVRKNLELLNEAF
eukprot:CAMPEP_0117430284 /NCGR_PEP_ID=MMETSP0758-20121206/9811_1 /TAXON_ID=63605 /ORGANISM="Percolomonas cosmopolitus, Strain AE-1 (ATCC 50343)" /LENGTH=131 /DNA_ID=CAMNT_0005218125 /DNA_START=258 /DNA_END=653 /DNA_ORIENTATION=+